MIRLSAPDQVIRSTIHLSGSKSISNRLLILKEVLDLTTRFENLSTAEDTVLLENALQQIKGSKKAVIDLHHAGTDMRFLTALLSVTEGEWTLTGSERLRQRPIADLVEALKSLGAEISYLEKNNFPPLLIKGRALAGGTVEIESGVSSQFISALLLTACRFKNGLTLKLKGETVSQPYINMTVELLKQFNITVEQNEKTIRVIPFRDRPDFPPRFIVESDWSSASYWYSICALSRNAEVEVKYLNQASLQADSVQPLIFEKLGVKTVFKDNSIFLSPAPPDQGLFTYDFTHCPDIAQTVAVTCCGLNVNAHLTGLRTLRVKETDRIAALKAELEKCGMAVESGEDFMHLTCLAKTGRSLEGPVIATYHDHRMAMSFAPLAFLYRSLCIADEAVVAKSYPAFWEDLKSVGFNVNLRP